MYAMHLITYLQELWLHVVAVHEVRLDEVQIDAHGLGGQPDGAAGRGAGQVEEINGHVGGNG